MVRLEVLPAALPVMPELLPLLLALGLLMLAFLAGQILAPLLSAFSHLPNPIGQWFSDRVNDVEAWASHTAAAALTQVIQAVLAVWARIEWVNRVLVSALTETIDAVESAAANTAGVLLPALRDWAAGLVNGVYAWASQQLVNLQQWVLNQLGPIPGLIQGAVEALRAQLLAYVNQAAQDVQNIDQAAINALGGWTAAQVAAALATAEGDILKEAQRAALAEGATLATAQAYSAALQADLNAKVFGPGGAVQELESELATGLNGTLTAALAGALALARPLELAISDIKDSSCMKACNPLGAFGAALETLDLAAIVALAAVAYANPTGTRDAVRSLVAPVVSEIDSLVESVLGVRR